jgi:hypothetical protein
MIRSHWTDWPWFISSATRFGEIWPFGEKNIAKGARLDEIWPLGKKSLKVPDQVKFGRLGKKFRKRC